MDWVAHPTEIYCFTVLEARGLKSGARQGGLPLMSVRAGSDAGFSPWLLDSGLLPGLPSMPISAQMSPS